MVAFGLKVCFTTRMKKSDAIKAFGSVRKLADVLGVTPQRIYQLPDDLELKDEDRVTGAMVRMGLYKPNRTKAA